jgi:hypothetical protein
VALALAWTAAIAVFAKWWFGRLQREEALA